MPPDEGRPQPPASEPGVPAPRDHESAGETPTSHCAVCTDPFERAPVRSKAEANQRYSLVFRIRTVSGKYVCSRTCELAENERLKKIQESGIAPESSEGEGKR